MPANALSPTERADRAESRVSRRSAKDKAMKLRLIEGGTFVAASILIGGLEARFPNMAAFGPGDRLNLGVLLLGVGVVALFFGKGVTKEFGSGLAYAGAGPFLRDFGVRILGGS